MRCMALPVYFAHLCSSVQTLLCPARNMASTYSPLASAAVAPRVPCNHNSDATLQQHPDPPTQHSLPSFLLVCFSSGMASPDMHFVGCWGQF